MFAFKASLLRKHWRDLNLAKHTVKELKEILRDQGLKRSGNKQTIIARLEEHRKKVAQFEQQPKVTRLFPFG